MFAANLNSSQEAITFLGRMQSLEKSQEGFRNPKQYQNSRGIELRQPNGRDQGRGRDYREAPRETRHVRYGYRKRNPRTPHWQDTSVRRRNYQIVRENMQQAHELDPRTPEFHPRGIDDRQILVEWEHIQKDLGSATPTPKTSGRTTELCT
jgi:hypothetical protein